MFFYYFLFIFIFEKLDCSNQKNKIKKPSLELIKELFDHFKKVEGINRFLKNDISSKEILDLRFEEKDINHFFSYFWVTFPKEIFYKIANDESLKQYFSNTETSNKEIFFENLLFKRPYCFDNFSSFYYVNEDFKGIDLHNKFLDLCMKIFDEKNFLTKYERLISPYLSIVKKVNFLNDGRIYNYGKKVNFKNFFESGYIITVIGPAFDISNGENDPRIKYTDYSSIIITKTQNIQENGYGEDFSDKNMQGNLLIQKKIFGENENFPTFEDANMSYIISNYKYKGEIFKNDYFKIDDDSYLNINGYKERIRITINDFLKKANLIGNIDKGGITASVLGLGLGIWEKKGLEEIQEKLMLNVYAEILQKEDFKNIKNIRFLYFKENNSPQKEFLIDVLINKEIKFEFIEYSDEIGDDPAPYEKTEYLKNANLKLVSMFPWNGFTYIGGDDISGNFLWNLTQEDRLSLMAVAGALVEKILI